MGTFWIILLFVLLMALVVALWFRERRYLKKKTSEAMSKGVWKEIIDEREETLKKRRLFREALEKAKSGIKR